MWKKELSPEKELIQALNKLTMAVNKRPSLYVLQDALEEISQLLHERGWDCDNLSSLEVALKEVFNALLSSLEDEILWLEGVDGSLKEGREGLRELLRPSRRRT